MTSEHVWSLRARWVFPVSGPPIPDGVVTVEGERIVALGAAADRTPDLDLGDVAVLPGLVNAHTHLDLSGMRGLAPPTPDFTAWLRQVIAHRRTRSPEQVRADIRAGLAECLRFGTTLLGDISGDGGTWAFLAAAPVRAIIFREMLALPPPRAIETWKSIRDWLMSVKPTTTCRAGLSPHAPYSAHRGLIRSAISAGPPMTIHLAETQAEVELLERRD